VSSSLFPGGQAANSRHGTQWERHPRYRPGPGGEPDDGDDHAQKKAPELHRVNPALLPVGEGVETAVVIQYAFMGRQLVWQCTTELFAAATRVG
jgi:hypothetical protein